jgi:CDP-4-dehydro-6-deoxyglucose reductase/ferredoxin-NAD(P)+ reductase (naphthalene dioxygenase ferredoxin-specific)
VSPPHTLLTCRIAELEAATPDIRILRLAPPANAGFDFRPGQYAKLGFGQLPPRDYSMASRPGAPLVEFHIRDMGNGPSRYAVRELKLGETVSLTGPLGGAYLRAEHAGPIIAVAGGSGLAPMKSIIDAALHLGLRQEVRLYVGARTARDLYLVEHFDGLAAAHANFRFIPVLSEPEGPTAMRTGLVGELVAADIAALPGAKTYLAGPPIMVESTVSLLLARGVDQADIHADPFYGDAEARRRGI